MKSLFLIIVLSVVCCNAFSAPTATVNIQPSACVSGDFFTLGQIAVVTCTDTAFRLELLGAVMGRSPLEGLTRPLTLGDVNLKLRQAGIDPTTVTFTGASAMVISAGSASFARSSMKPVSSLVSLPALTTPAAPAELVPTSPASGPLPVVIHRGDSVTLVYNDGTMSISATVTAMGPGSVGDTIQLRRDGALQPLQGIVQDAHTVTMVE
jgi:hypothetical protein